MKTLFIILLMGTLLFAPTPSMAGDGWLDIKKGLEKVIEKEKGSLGLKGGGVKGLTDKKIGAGLKDALRVGAENTVAKTGKKDGFLKNPKIKIPMPQELKKIEKIARKTGQGKRADKFILSMNKAAEAAAPEAKEIFINAISDMTIDDVRKIYKGSDTAATEYFKDRTSDDLRIAFAPIVKASTEKVGVTKKYKKFVGKNSKLFSLVGHKPFDPDEYVTTKTLEGLFIILAEEEQKIRTDPKARVTDILKEVFGKH